MIAVTPVILVIPVILSDPLSCLVIPVIVRYFSLPSHPSFPYLSELSLVIPVILVFPSHLSRPSELLSQSSLVMSGIPVILVILVFLSRFRHPSDSRHLSHPLLSVVISGYPSHPSKPSHPSHP